MRLIRDLSWQALTGTVLPCLFVLALPLLAEASCGDYLHQPAMAQPAPIGQPADGPLPRLPCRGPMCTPQLPPLLPAPPVPQPDLDDERLTVAAQSCDFGAILLGHFDGAAPRPDNPVQSAIFHPPR